MTSSFNAFDRLSTRGSQDGAMEKITKKRVGKTVCREYFTVADGARTPPHSFSFSPSHSLLRRIPTEFRGDAPLGTSTFLLESEESLLLFAESLLLFAESSSFSPSPPPFRRVLLFFGMCVCMCGIKIAKSTFGQNSSSSRAVVRRRASLWSCVVVVASHGIFSGLSPRYF